MTAKFRRQINEFKKILKESSIVIRKDVLSQEKSIIRQMSFKQKIKFYLIKYFPSFYFNIKQ